MLRAEYKGDASFFITLHICEKQAKACFLRVKVLGKKKMIIQ